MSTEQTEQSPIGQTLDNFLNQAESLLHLAEWQQLTPRQQRQANLIGRTIVGLVDSVEGTV